MKHYCTGGGARRGRQILAAAPLAAAFGAMLASCGAGPAQLAGIEGTGAQVAAVSSGAISGFGSIFVNGVEFATSGAAFVANGQAGAESDLRAGQVVQVIGAINADGATGTATRVQFNANAQGPVSATDLAVSSFTVFGQTFLVGPNTSFGAEAGGTPTLATMPVGALVVVSGFTAAGGGIKATRVDIKSRLDAFILSGVVQSVDSAMYRLTLNGQIVDFGAAQLSGFPAGRSVQAGDTVQVTSAPSLAQGVVEATRIALQGGPAGGNGQYGQLSGDVASVVSAADFTVSGTRVVSNAATVYQNGQAGNIALNSSLEVRGSFDAAGTLVAANITFLKANPLLLKGLVQAVDASRGTLTLVGVAASTNRETRFDDQSANPVAPFNLAAVRVGDYVEVRGESAPGNAVVATLLTRQIPQNDVELRGSATAIAAPGLTVLGVDAVTSASTQFLAGSGGSITSAQFFALAAGATVDLQGPIASGVLQVRIAKLAAQSELED